MTESEVQVLKGWRPKLVRGVESTRCKSKLKLAAISEQLVLRRGALPALDQTLPRCLSRRVTVQGPPSALPVLRTQARRSCSKSQDGASESTRVRTLI